MQESVGMKTVELVFFDAGGGHRSAANALCEVVRQQDRPWDMKMMNLQELLDEMDIFRKLTRPAPAGHLQSPAAAWLDSRLAGAHEGHAWRDSGTAFEASQSALELLEEQSAGPGCFRDPEFLNRAIHHAIRRVMPKVPMVTILTDMADYPPHFWIERQPQYLICGTQRAYDQAIQLGHAPDHVFRTSGMRI